MHLGASTGLGPTMQPSQAAVALFAEATVLNDLTPTSTPATNAVDPYTGASSGGARRRRPILVAGRSVSSDLVEGSRTNLCLRSQDFDNATWVKTASSVSANAVAAPDGTVTADALIENTASSLHWIGQASIALADQQRTGSFYVKAAGRTIVQVELTSNSGTSGGRVVADLTTATITTSVGIGSPAGTVQSSSITHVGNSWYRVSITCTPGSAGNTSATIGIYLRNASGTTYTGDGSSGVYLWGVQVEAGAFPSSYIPTTAASVTRGADSLSVSLASLSGGGLSTTDGTILALTVPYGWDVAASGGASGYAAYTVSPAGTFSNAVLRHNVAGANVNARRVDSTPSGNEITAGATVSGLNRFAHVWSGSEHRLYASGVSVSVDNSVLSPYTLDTAITLGHQTGGFAYLHGWVGLLYWPRALTAAEIATVSQQSGLAGAGAL